MPRDPEKVKAYKRTYYKKHKEEVLEKNKIYYKKNKERILEKSKTYRTEHKAEILAKARQYREKNKDRIRIRDAAYAAAHRDEKKVYNSGYYALHREYLCKKATIYCATHKEQCRRRRRLSKGSRVDPNAPRLTNSMEIVQFSKNKGAVRQRHKMWKRRLKIAGVPEEMLNTAIEQMERSHENRRKYLMNWSAQQRATQKYRTKLQQEEQSRFALAFTGG